MFQNYVIQHGWIVFSQCSPSFLAYLHWNESFFSIYFSTVFRLTTFQYKPAEVIYLLETNPHFLYWSGFFIVLRQSQGKDVKGEKLYPGWLTILRVSVRG